MSIKSALTSIGMLAAEPLQKTVGDTITVTVGMSTPGPVHLIGFELHFGPELALDSGSTWGSLPTPDDSAIVARAYGAYAEYSLMPLNVAIPAGQYVIAEIKLKCIAPMENTAIILANFIASTYKDNAPAEYASSVTQAPALVIVAQQSGEQVLVTVSIA